MRPRGRPRGSGIDDAAHLDAVKSLLAADPKLKPTTAIKLIGISNPSVVRRLRNKLADTEPTGRVASPSRAVAPVPAKPATVATAAPQKRTEEATLLAAYLEALRASPPPTAPSTPTPAPAQPPPQERPVAPLAPPIAAAPPSPPTPEPPKPLAPPQQTPPANPFASAFAGFPLPGMPAMPSFPGMPPFGGLPGAGIPMGMPGMPNMAGMPGFSFPGFPSFMQPFQQKPQAAQPGTDAFRQLEAFKLAIEAMTAIARFQLHLVQNAAAYSPTALMLQGQAFMGQMLMASLTGQMDALKPKPPPGAGGKP